jgi:hypothetical protein
VLVVPGKRGAFLVVADGSTIGAPVVSNVYVVEDPSWSPPVFVDT